MITFLIKKKNKQLELIEDAFETLLHFILLLIPVVSFYMSRTFRCAHKVSTYDAVSSSSLGIQGNVICCPGSGAIRWR